MVCGSAPVLYPSVLGYPVLKPGDSCARAGCKDPTSGEADWAAGYGVVAHSPATRARVRAMVSELVASGTVASEDIAYRRLAAADRLASAGMWLVVHMTYARRVRLDGRPLAREDFKPVPEGHTGGALNMVPAYAGYLLLGALDRITRAWMMGQGHCVAAIDALNVLVDNMSAEHARRYDRTEAGLSRLVSDFYAYGVRLDGGPASPLGSHVNAHTAGGVMEGGYLGFAELEYVHAPLRGERLVAFLSDGAFEEQRGGDWAPRWWQSDDCGLVAPLMILNGRRIDQRTQIMQQGGERWLERHLRLNGFDPIELDGRDPASIAWGIREIEKRLQERAAAGGAVALPYGIAETTKGFGFPGAGTNRAHNLPLPGVPSADAGARRQFNDGAARLYVAPGDLDGAITDLQTHGPQGRPKERAHPLAARRVDCPQLPRVEARADGGPQSSMAAIDAQFVAIVEANPGLRVRVGNPDELRSNGLHRTLERLKHRVQVPEPGLEESRTGSVITVLNEEAVACAALANTGGLNLVVTYEAFAPKMLGALRQHAIFARQCRLAGREPGWRGVPLVLTSHTWENAKNEQSHQDPTLAEAWLGEMSDVARVVFPMDATSAASALRRVYAQTGHITAMVVPKRPVPQRLDAHLADRLDQDGVLLLEGDPYHAHVLLIAVGAYQLLELERCRARLLQRDVPSALLYLAEPGRFRAPRDAAEAAYVHGAACIGTWFPRYVPRVFLSHTRPEPLLGVLRPLDTGPATTAALGYINRGGTLTTPELLFANRASWAHALDAAAWVMRARRGLLLSAAEQAAIDGVGDPRQITAPGPAPP